MGIEGVMKKVIIKNITIIIKIIISIYLQFNHVVYFLHISKKIIIKKNTKIKQIFKLIISTKKTLYSISAQSFYKQITKLTFKKTKKNCKLF